MEAYGIPEYESYWEAVEFEEYTNEDLVNFVYVLDDKTSDLNAIEQKVVIMLAGTDDVDKHRTLYEHHLDLFIQNQNSFKQSFNDARMQLQKFMRQRVLYASVDKYFNTLKMKSRDTITPVTPTSRFSPLTLFSPKSASSGKGGLFSKHPEGSIFANVDPVDFAATCHKMFLFYYFMMETRYYHYYSKFEKVSMGGYAGEFKSFFNNFYRKLELEVELYCLSKQFSLLTEIIITVTQAMLELGNIPLAKICIMLLDRFKLCKEKRISQFKETVRDLKSFNKYQYLIDPDSIRLAFVSSREVKNRTTAFTKIYTKVAATRKLILSEQLDVHVQEADSLVYSFLQPDVFIIHPLYAGTKSEIECIKERCK